MGLVLLLNMINLQPEGWQAGSYISYQRELSSLVDLICGVIKSVSSFGTPFLTCQFAIPASLAPFITCFMGHRLKCAEVHMCQFKANGLTRACYIEGCALRA